MLEVLCIIGFLVQLIRGVFSRLHLSSSSTHICLALRRLLTFCLTFTNQLTWQFVRPRRSSFKRLLRTFILPSCSVHLLKVCWIFVKRTYFKSLLKVYYRSVFPESFKTFIFQKFRRPLCHKVNLPRCEARRHRFIMTCDIFRTGQTNILGLCYLFGKTYKKPTAAPLKSLKSTPLTKLLSAVIETDHTISLAFKAFS